MLDLIEKAEEPRTAIEYAIRKKKLDIFSVDLLNLYELLVSRTMHFYKNLPVVCFLARLKAEKLKNKFVYRYLLKESVKGKKKEKKEEEKTFTEKKKRKEGISLRELKKILHLKSRNPATKQLSLVDYFVEFKRFYENAPEVFVIDKKKKLYLYYLLLKRRGGEIEVYQEVPYSKIKVRKVFKR